MSTIIINEKITNFSAMMTNGAEFVLSQFEGKNLVLYFYPKDSTPGCTQESRAFAEQYPEFLSLNTEIIGISRDSIKSHEKFICKYELPFQLISDADETVCKLFDVLKLKQNYGREYTGIERSTFLIDSEGVLRQQWRGVKVAGHAEEVLEAARAL